ncbi:PepSY domain-containing protein [Acinetobacter pittii]|uniref:PepSY-associated TM helix domain-containing protein n=1 Tax=Acinetobacter pittii TaxID=48296 RepID=UPI001EFDA5B6|nr:PepSY-associated TM helix domain-containing protein [Acinetobacter pittii]MCG9510465.1 PepSY domain-containing protein [Acinetobacter pittii]
MRIDGNAESPRQSMSWLHTWASLVLGWLLYAIFVTGTLSFFQNEISIWMKPELHQSINRKDQSQQLQSAIAYLQQNAPNASAWNINLPNARSTTTDITIRGENEDPRARRGGERVILDSVTGEKLQPRETRGGGFLYRFHFELYGLPRGWARWIVGIATVLMFVAIISGVITHKKIFKDFFTFRSGKGQRSWLDGHNATAVLALPFHIMITFSGLLLLMYSLMPYGVSALFPEGRLHFLQAQRAQLNGETIRSAELASSSQKLDSSKRNGHGEGEKGRLNKEKNRLEVEKAPLADLTPMLAQAQNLWGDNPVASFNIISPNRQNSEVEIRATYSESILNRAIVPTLIFNGVTGELISHPQQLKISVPIGIYNTVTVLHEARGVDLGLRWLLFFSGILGTVMVASGLVLWCIKRAPQQQKQGYKNFGYRLVEVLNIASISGLLIATAGYFYANRLIPVATENRSFLEIKIFFIVWLLTLLHAALRTHRNAWLEQLLFGAILFCAIPLLNALTGGRVIWSSIAEAQWVVATFDLMSLALGMILLFIFYKVKKHKVAGIHKTKKNINLESVVARGEGQ